MRTTRLTVAVAVLVTVLLGLATSPVLAQSAGASVTSPEDGAKVDGWVTVGGTASGGASGLQRASLSIGGVLVREAGPFDCPNAKSSVDFSYDWNTNVEISGGALARNRQQTIKVTTVACGAGPVEDAITAYVNNPPAAPTGVSASVSGQNATVRWNANPEPDIAAYAVVRDGMSTRVSATSFSEDLPPGTYSYRITALREGTHGLLASPTVSSNQITIEQPPPPPSSSNEPSSSGSSPPPSEPSSGSSSPPSDPNESPGASEGNPDSGGDPGWGEVHEVSLGDDFGGGGSSGGGLDLETFDVAAARLTSLDLPALMTLGTLPAFLPPLDTSASDPRDPTGGWGQFLETTPYEPPVEAGDGSFALPGQLNIAARSPDRIIPPDQMQWLLAGVIAMTLAGLFLYLDLRLQGGIAKAGSARGSSDRGSDRRQRESHTAKPRRLMRRFLDRRSSASPR